MNRIFCKLSLRVNEHHVYDSKVRPSVNRIWFTSLHFYNCSKVIKYWQIRYKRLKIFYVPPALREKKKNKSKVGTGKAKMNCVRTMHQ